jgi:hypothetical protein
VKGSARPGFDADGAAGQRRGENPSSSAGPGRGRNGPGRTASIHAMFRPVPWSRACAARPTGPDMSKRGDATAPSSCDTCRPASGVRAESMIPGTTWRPTTSSTSSARGVRSDNLGNPAFRDNRSLTSSSRCRDPPPVFQRRSSYSPSTTPRPLRPHLSSTVPPEVVALPEPWAGRPPQIGMATDSRLGLALAQDGRSDPRPPVDSRQERPCCGPFHFFVAPPPSAATGGRYVAARKRFRR